MEEVLGVVKLITQEAPMIVAYDDYNGSISYSLDNDWYASEGGIRITMEEPMAIIQTTVHDGDVIIFEPNKFVYTGKITGIYYQINNYEKAKQN